MKNHRSNGVRREPNEKHIDLRTPISEDSTFIEPHKYRVIRKLDMGPVVAAALEAVYERRCRCAH